MKDIYIDKKEFSEEIKKSILNGELTSRSIEIIQIMTKKILNGLRYKNLKDKDDCFQSAVLDVLKYWKNYDINRGDAFAYFTSVIKNGIAKGFNELHPNIKKNIKIISINNIFNF